VTEKKEVLDYNFPFIHCVIKNFTSTVFILEFNLGATVEKADGQIPKLWLFSFPEIAINNKNTKTTIQATIAKVNIDEK
jgi:hypothetical protein